MSERAVPLPPQDREALRRVARSRQVTHGAGVRARVVLDCAEVGVTEAARRASVSATSANRWWRTYRESGIEALLEVRPSRGRPTVTTADLRAVLTRVLAPPPAGRATWTTRAIAEATGVSQATVSRIRRRRFPVAEPGTDVGLLVTYVDIGPAGCALGYRREGAAAPSAVATEAVETVLCAALSRRPVADEAPPAPAAGTPAALLRRAERHVDLHTPMTLVVDVPLDAAADAWAARHPTVTLLSRPGAAWLAQLHPLAALITPAQLRELREVRSRIRAAAASGDPWEFQWARDLAEPAPFAPPPAHAPPVPPPAAAPLRASVHDISATVAALCSALAAGSLSPGEPVSVRRTSEQAGLSRHRAAEVMTYLAEQAILDRVDGRFRLPAPAPRDVIETYTARGLLGTAVVRRMASARTAPPDRVDVLLARIVRCARDHRPAEAYALDMDLQDEIALASGMPRISWMFAALTAQVRLFIAALGLDYRYPTDEIVADDQRIIDAIREGDPDRAVDAWRTKVDNCVRYMLAQLPPPPRG
ncbi:FCD domain-containing protein [Tsukamurella asaccharolytica]|uniref:FCD domain-containing protein n=1 Tax=Tsukamurella asaccharolytica TaxID=2592067 RepID=A0A5C5R489_9ACTN|nr:FCD domain-containing protein [Tsukamurella asaccharolytica]TWS17940.1 FCD domain-containing protein [Tsukamurella asaccharolytica]